jgi:nitroreductase
MAALEFPVNPTALPPERLRQILAAGIRAPSAENLHFLRFEPGAGTLTLVATDAASWTSLPHRKWLALMSYGAVVENMALRAGTFGYAQDVRWQPDPERPERIAELCWVTTSAPADPLAQVIDARHTNRRFYRRARLEPAVLQALGAATQSVAQTRLVWCDSPELRSIALRVLRLAETERFRRRELHAELFSAVRFDKGWRATAQEGLPPGALQVEAPMRPPFAALRHWPVMRAATWAGMHLSLGLRAAYLPCALAPHIGVVLAEGDTADARDLRAGRAFQRVWLAATAAGLALQPFAAPIALSRQKPGFGWVDAGLQERLQSLLGVLVGASGGHPSMFFRLGRAQAPQTVTDRLPVEHYLA